MGKPLPPDDLAHLTAQLLRARRRPQTGAEPFVVTSAITESTVGGASGAPFPGVRVPHDARLTELHVNLGAPFAPALEGQDLVAHLVVVGPSGTGAPVRVASCRVPTATVQGHTLDLDVLVLRESLVRWDVVAPTVFTTAGRGLVCQAIMDNIGPGVAAADTSA